MLEEALLLLLGTVITVAVVVVEEVETVTCTHLPLFKVNPNLLEHVLHATPPSL